MATASKYRHYAQECMQCARETATDDVRARFLDLAKRWTTAADRIDAPSDAPEQPGRNADRPTPPKCGEAGPP